MDPPDEHRLPIAGDDIELPERAVALQTAREELGDGLLDPARGEIGCVGHVPVQVDGGIGDPLRITSPGLEPAAQLRCGGHPLRHRLPQLRGREPPSDPDDLAGVTGDYFGLEIQDRPVLGREGERFLSGHAVRRPAQGFRRTGTETVKSSPDSLPSDPLAASAS